MLFVNEHGIIKVLNMRFTAGERRTTKLPYSRATNAMQRGEWLLADARGEQASRIDGGAGDAREGETSDGTRLALPLTCVRTSSKVLERCVDNSQK